MAWKGQEWGGLKDDEQETVPQAEAVLDISVRETACQHEPAIYGHK